MNLYSYRSTIQPSNNSTIVNNNNPCRNIETVATPSYITADADKSLEERVEHLGMLADDAEARGEREEAAARHEDRIEAATAAAAALEGMCVWW